MIGKKDTLCIFEQYRNVIKEQAQESKVSMLLSKVKASSLDSSTKSELLEILENPQVQELCKTIYAQKAHGNGDADAAGYSSYPEAGPAEDNEEYQNCHLIANPREREICEYNKRKVGRASMAAQGKVDPNEVLRR
jgi:hypothetical protein